MNATTDPRAIVAARNNADWYAMMGDLHGCTMQRGDDAIIMHDPPAYHGWMVTLTPDGIAAQLADVRRFRGHSGFAIKDSFQQLDLAPLGLKSGFSAHWFYRAAPVATPTQGWERITSLSALEQWEMAWRVTSPVTQRQFPAAILKRADVAVWGRRSGNGYDAGGISNLSSDAIGITNFFGKDAMGPLASLAHATAPDCPLVGYARGDLMTAATAAGCVRTGPLQVWFA